MAMEFWGAEVKSGSPLKVKTGEGMVIHLSQASVGQAKKEKESDAICLFVILDGKEMVLATLFSDKLPQQQLSLVFDRDFELSHNWKAGSVFFYGYKARNPVEEPEDFDSDSYPDEDSDFEEQPPLLLNNWKSKTAVKEEKSETKAKEEKPAAIEKAKAGKNSAADKQKVKIVEPPKDDDREEESDDMDDDSSDERDEDEDDSEEDEESDDEETPTPKVQTGKKRAAAESVSKTPVPVPDKKAELTNPQKTDGKKGSGHVATPHPAKQAGKTPANKSDQKKSAGSFPCGPCKKTFKSETALQSHTKAKHSGGK